jgi:hypothetical protein
MSVLEGQGEFTAFGNETTDSYLQQQHNIKDKGYAKLRCKYFKITVLHQTKPFYSSWY